MKSLFLVGKDCRENLVVIKCISQSRFEHYALLSSNIYFIAEGTVLVSVS